MADDRDARIAQLEEELRQARGEIGALRAENAGLADDMEHLRPALTAAMEQQTATADILRVIASSPTDLRAVLDAVAEDAARLCDGDLSVIYRPDGEGYRAAVTHGPLTPEFR